MKIKKMQKLLMTVGIACACGAGAYAQISVPSTYKHITIDGSFNDWTGIPVAYTAAVGPSGAIQYQNIYVANDKSNIYVRVTLYSARTNAFANSYDNIFIDADNNPSTGYHVSGVTGFGSSMLIQSGSGHQEKNGGFNEGAIASLGWTIASSADKKNFEFAISGGASYVSDGTAVFNNDVISLMFEGDDTSHNNVEDAPPSGGLTYGFASQLGIMVPAYFSPGSKWDAMNYAASRVPLIAIMNPNNGPGASKSTSYVTALANLHTAGGKVVGYVYSSYTARALATVEADIDTYLLWYNVDGFFVDEMENDTNPSHIAYYQSLYQYIKSKGAKYSVTGNPGSNTQEAYLSTPTVDSLMIFENTSANYTSYSPSSWTTNYPPGSFVHLPYSATSGATMTNDVSLAISRNAGWTYVSDLSTYSALPTYWTNEVNLIESLNGSF